jgi:hypothetical protein
MLHCHFCEAELDTDTLRVRGGRCPSCGSILNWSESEPESPAPPAAGGLLNPPTAPVPPPGDDDNLSMRDIVRTLVQRGSPEQAPSAQRPPQSPAARSLALPIAPSSAPGGHSAASSTADHTAPEAIDNLWKGTLTVRANPLMTLKAASAEPDPSVSELLIRTHRIRFPDEHDQGQAEYELEET